MTTGSPASTLVSISINSAVLPVSKASSKASDSTAFSGFIYLSFKACSAFAAVTSVCTSPVFVSTEV